VRFSDAKLIKGFTQDFFPDKERFHLIPADNPSGGAMEVSMKDLKAIFMVWSCKSRMVWYNNS
jgi:hypothetical protein